MASDPLTPPAVEVPPAPQQPPRPPITETRPELLVAAAAAGGFVLAKVLGAVRGR